jgi:hypothetical protein
MSRLKEGTPAERVPSPPEDPTRLLLWPISAPLASKAWLHPQRVSQWGVVGGVGTGT